MGLVFRLNPKLKGHVIRRKEFRNRLVQLEKTNMELRITNDRLQRDVTRIQLLMKMMEDDGK